MKIIKGFPDYRVREDGAVVRLRPDGTRFALSASGYSPTYHMVDADGAWRHVSVTRLRYAVAHHEDPRDVSREHVPAGRKPLAPLEEAKLKEYKLPRPGKWLHIPGAGRYMVNRDCEVLSLARRRPRALTGGRRVELTMDDGQKMHHGRKRLLLAALMRKDPRTVVNNL